MKKTLLALMVCLLALLPMMAWAEGTETDAEALPVEAETAEAEEELPLVWDGDRLQLNMVFQYMPALKPIQGTGYMTVESKKDNSLALFSTDGRQIMPYGHAAINYLNNDFFTASKDKEALNGLAIYKGDGRQISDYAYARVQMYDARWIAGTVVEEPAGEESDLEINKVKYLISRWDLYYVAEGAQDGFLVASLDRTQFAEAKQHGDLIAIKDREGAVRVYDHTFQAVPVEVTDVKAALYHVENYQVVSNITGEVIAAGYSEVKEQDLPTRMVLVVGATTMSGVKVNTILDLDGNELMPAEYTVVTMGDPYVVVANAEGQKGLYSLEEKRLIVPCNFTNIVASTTSTNPYVNNGYVCVETNGKRGYVNAATSETTCEPAYNARIAKFCGCSTVFDGESGWVLIAGDGQRTDFDDLEEIVVTRGDGYLLVAKKGGFYGVIDWHGNEVLPFIHKNVITFTDDSRAMIRVSTGQELDVITAR